MKKKQWMMPLLCLLVLVLLIGVYFEMKNHKTKDDAAKKDAKETVLIDMKSDDINYLSFNLEGQETSFTKNDDSWVEDQNQKLQLDSSKITTIVNSMAELKSDRTIKEVKDLDEYGLKTPVNQLTLKDKDNKEVTINVGLKNKTTNNTYINRENNTNTVYMVSTDLSSIIPESSMELIKEEEYPSITDSNIMKIEIKNKSELMSLDTDDDGGQWYVSDNQDKRSTAASETVGTLKTAISGLKFDSMVDDSEDNLDQYGLKEPSHTVKVHYYEVKTSDSKKTDDSDTDSSSDGRQSETSDSDKQERTEKDMVLKIGNQGSDGSYYVQIDGSNEIHTMASVSLDNVINQSAQNYWSKSLVTLKNDQLNNVTVEYKGKKKKIDKISKEKKDKKGNTSKVTSYQIDGKQINTDTFDVFFNKVTSMQAQSKDTALQQKQDPEMSILFETENGEKKVVFSPYDENFYFIIDAEGRPGLISKTTVKELFSAYEKIK